MSQVVSVEQLLWKSSQDLIARSSHVTALPSAQIPEDAEDVSTILTQLQQLVESETAARKHCRAQGTS